MRGLGRGRTWVVATGMVAGALLLVRFVREQPSLRAPQEGGRSRAHSFHSGTADPAHRPPSPATMGADAGPQTAVEVASAAPGPTSPKMAPPHFREPVKVTAAGGAEPFARFRSALRGTRDGTKTLGKDPPPTPLDALVQPIEVVETHPPDDVDRALPGEPFPEVEAPDPALSEGAAAEISVPFDLDQFTGRRTDELKQGLRNPDPAAAAGAYLAWKTTDAAAATSALQGLVNDRAEPSRNQLLEILLGDLPLGAPEWRTTLEAWLGDPEPGFAEVARQTLGRDWKADPAGK